MFGCEYCHRIEGHHNSCPNYTPPKTNYYCSICNEGIQNGEDYIINDDNDYAHWECFYGTKHLAEWLGYTVREMEDGEY